MNWPKITIGFFYLLSAAIMISNAYTFTTLLKYISDPILGLPLTILLFAQTLFWFAIGALLMVYTHRRSRQVVSITLVAFVYLCLALSVTLFSMISIYSKSGADLGVAILVGIIASGAAQLVLAGATYLIARKLRSLGHLT